MERRRALTQTRSEVSKANKLLFSNLSLSLARSLASSVLMITVKIDIIR